ncbi:ABC transporter substrate-binding protein [bacterium]|nr:MAG: ABC transporter substrate-binding protein [bacterium]
MKNAFFITMVILLIIFFQKESESSEKLKVVATIYPLAHFAEQVGGRYVEVTNVMPHGVEPHEYEPTPGDIREIYESGIFLMNGAGLDMWAGIMLGELRKEGIIIIEIAQQLDSLIETGSDVPPDGGKNDPHFWLDPLLAIKEVQILRDAFIRTDPGHADAYRENSEKYTKELSQLHVQYREGLATCKLRDIIVTHDAFNYLARRYDLHPYSISGLSPEEEPSPRKMVELTKIAREKRIQIIFFESLVSPRMARTIAREVGAEVLVLHPLGGLTSEESREGKTYISIMEENLRNLRRALSCNS